VILLVFFSTVHVIATGTKHPIDFYLPGILGLAVMSTSMVSLGIATGFERGYGVLRRLGSTPLGRSRLLGAKAITVGIIEVIQALVLVLVGIGLGWHSDNHTLITLLLARSLGIAILSSVSFSAIGLFFAGRLKAELNLAFLNGLYLVFLLVGGMIIPFSRFPHALGIIAKVLPAGALATGLIGAFGGSVSLHDWVVLGVWALVAPIAAAMTFRFES
jgi:ABC-2 type transport system permease protein